MPGRYCARCDKVVGPGHTHRGGSTRAQRLRRERILFRDGFRCYYCGTLATTEDHLTPVSRGGSEADWNLVACCASCNGSKGAMTEEEFRQSDHFPVGSH